MINYINNLWSDFQDNWGQEELGEQTTWKYYTRNRAVFHGLPIAAITAAASAYLFQATSAKTGAIFGTVNYITLTTFIEAIRAHYEIDPPKAVILVGMACLVSHAMMETIFKASISYQTAIMLGVASFAGQLARDFFINEDT